MLHFCHTSLSTPVAAKRVSACKSWTLDSGLDHGLDWNPFLYTYTNNSKSPCPGRADPNPAGHATVVLHVTNSHSATRAFPETRRPQPLAFNPLANANLAPTQAWKQKKARVLS